MLRRPDPVGECVRIDVSGLTFLCGQCDIAPSSFAAPLHFVAGNRPTEFRGAVSVGAVSSERGDATKSSYRFFEGVPRLFSRGKQKRDGRIILSDEAKGVSL